MAKVAKLQAVLDTGEIASIERLDAFSQVRSRSRMKEAFLMAVLSGCAEVARMNLTAVEHKVLWFLLSRCRRGGVVTATQARVARDLDLTAAQVSRAVARLVKLDVVSRGIDDDGVRVVKLNPRLFVMESDGPAASRRKAVARPPDPAAEAA